MAMLFAMIFWGFSFIWTKQVLDTYKPITIIFFRLIISASFLYVVGRITKVLIPLKAADLKLILVLSFFEPFLYFLGENFGLNRVSSTVTAVLVATIPLFSPLAAYIFFKERISAMNFVGIIISVLGVLMVVLKNDLTLAADVYGILLIMLAVFSAIAYSIFVVKVSDRYNVFSIIMWQNLFGSILFLPLFFIFELGHFREIGLQKIPILNIVYLALFASSLAFMLYTYGIRNLGVVKANTLSNTIPVFTAIFAYFIIGEQLTLLNIAGIGVVVSGLLLSQINYDRMPHKMVRAFFHEVVYRYKKNNNKNIPE